MGNQKTSNDLTVYISSSPLLGCYQLWCSVPHPPPEAKTALDSAQEEKEVSEMLPQMQPSFCFTRKPMGRLDHRLLCSFAFGSQYSGQLRLILQDFVGKEWSSDGGALKLWHWYLVVVCQSCTEWLSQGRTEKLDLLLLRVAKMQFKRENGSVSLQISKMEMRYFSQNDKGFFSSQPTRQSSEVYWGIGGEG